MVLNSSTLLVAIPRRRRRSVRAPVLPSARCRSAAPIRNTWLRARWVSGSRPTTAPRPIAVRPAVFLLDSKRVVRNERDCVLLPPRHRQHVLNLFPVLLAVAWAAPSLPERLFAIGGEGLLQNSKLQN